MQIVTAKNARKLCREGEAFKTRTWYQPSLDETYQVIFVKRTSKLACYYLKKGK